MEFLINTHAKSTLEATTRKIALEKIAKNFDTENIKFLAELAEKPNSNEKFNKLKSNKLVLSLL